MHIHLESKNSIPDLFITNLSVTKPVPRTCKSLFQYFEMKLPLPNGDEISSLRDLTDILTTMGVSIHRLTTKIAPFSSTSLIQSSNPDAIQSNVFVSILFDLEYPKDDLESFTKSHSAFPLMSSTDKLVEYLTDIISGLTEHYKKHLSDLMKVKAVKPNNNTSNNMYNRLLKKYITTHDQIDSTKRIIGFVNTLTDKISNGKVDLKETFDIRSHSPIPLTEEKSDFGPWNISSSDLELLIPTEYIEHYLKTTGYPRHQKPYSINDANFFKALPACAYVHPNLRASHIQITFIGNAFPRNAQVLDDAEKHIDMHRSKDDPVEMRFDIENKCGKFYHIAEWFSIRNINLRSVEVNPFDDSRSTVRVVADAKAYRPAHRKDDDNIHTKAYSRQFQRSIPNRLYREAAYKQMYDKYIKVTDQLIERYKKLRINHAGFMRKIRKTEVFCHNKNYKLVEVYNNIQAEHIDTILKIKRDILWNRYIGSNTISNSWRLRCFEPLSMYVRKDEKRWNNFYSYDEFKDVWRKRINTESIIESTLEDACSRFSVEKQVNSSSHKFCGLFSYMSRLEKIRGMVDNRKFRDAQKKLTTLYTKHDVRHSERVLNYCHLLVDGLVLTTEEMFLLISACLLHDIGMTDPKRIQPAKSDSTQEQRRINANDIRFDHAHRAASLAYAIWCNDSSDIKLFNPLDYGAQATHLRLLDALNVYERIPELEDYRNERKHGCYEDFYNSVMTCHMLNRERRLLSKIIKAHNRDFKIEDRMWDEDIIKRAKIYKCIQEWTEDIDSNIHESIASFIWAIHEFVDKPMYGRTRLLAAVLRVADGLDFSRERIPISNIMNLVEPILRENDEMKPEDIIAELKRKHGFNEKNRYEYAINGVVSRIVLNNHTNTIHIYGSDVDENNFDEIEKWLWIEPMRNWGIASLLREVGNRVQREIDSVNDTLKQYRIEPYKVEIFINRKNPTDKDPDYAKLPKV